MKKTVRFVGWVLFVLSLIYVGKSLFSNIDVVLRVGFGSDTVLVILMGSILHALLLIPTSMGWGVLLTRTLNTPVIWPQIISVYGRAHIAKYLPGNVFHYVGRQLLGHGMGWSQRDIAIASFLETVLVIFVCCCLVAVLGHLVDGSVIGGISTVFMSLIAACVVLLLWLLLRNMEWIPLFNKFIDLRTVGKAVRSRFLLAGGLYVIGFGVSIVLIWAIHSVHVDEWTWRSLPVTGLAFILSWLAGYLTPGTPGGVGIREAGLIFFLGSGGEVGISVTTALAYRAVTVLGEILQFAFAFWVHRAIVNR